MITHLKKLGLTETESNCYLALYEKPNQTGYEVAKNLGLSRSNVYAALKSLEAKGGCVSTKNDTTTYTAVAIKDFLNILRVDFKKSSRALRTELSKSMQAPFEIRTIQGEKQLMHAITRILMSATSTITLEASEDNLNLIEPILKEIELEPTISKGEDLMINVDDEAIFMGSLDETRIPSGIMTRHPAIVKQFIDHLNNKKLIQKIIDDQGPGFIKQYL